MPKNDGEPAVCMKCSEPASHFQGRNWYCPKHYRLGQMRYKAKYTGKVAPTEADLEALIPADMCCPICNEEMVWLKRDSSKRVLTLQHYRDGTLGVLCQSCNTRHAFHPDDMYRDEGGPDTKWCGRCEQVLPLDAFYQAPDRLGDAYCKPCRNTGGPR